MSNINENAGVFVTSYLRRWRLWMARCFFLLFFARPPWKLISSKFFQSCWMEPTHAAHRATHDDRSSAGNVQTFVPPARVTRVGSSIRTETRGHVPGLLGPDLARHVEFRSSRKIHRLGWEPKGGCFFFMVSSPSRSYPHDSWLSSHRFHHRPVLHLAHPFCTIHAFQPPGVGFGTEPRRRNGSSQRRKRVERLGHVDGS